MTNGTFEFADTPRDDRWEIMRRAEDLRAEETRRLASALFRRIRSAFAAVFGQGVVTERVFIPRSPSSAIF